MKEQEKLYKEGYRYCVISSQGSFDFKDLEAALEKYRDSDGAHIFKTLAPHGYLHPICLVCGENVYPHQGCCCEGKEN